jgi:hypothetical protein
MWVGLRLGMLPMISLYDFRGEHLFLRLPRIICCGISPPPYQVLQLAPFSEESMPHDVGDFIFFRSVDHFGRWWVGVVPVLFCFAIRSQQGCMEHVMDGPGQGEVQLISDWRHSLCDHKGAMTFGGQLAHLIRQGQVLRFQPDVVPYLELVLGGVFRHLV